MKKWGILCLLACVVAGCDESKSPSADPDPSDTLAETLDSEPSNEDGGLADAAPTGDPERLTNCSAVCRQAMAECDVEFSYSAPDLAGCVASCVERGVDDCVAGGEMTCREAFVCIRAFRHPVCAGTCTALAQCGLTSSPLPCRQLCWSPEAKDVPECSRDDGCGALVSCVMGGDEEATQCALACSGFNGCNHGGLDCRQICRADPAFASCVIAAGENCEAMDACHTPNQLACTRACSQATQCQFDEYGGDDCYARCLPEPTDAYRCAWLTEPCTDLVACAADDPEQAAPCEKLCGDASHCFPKLSDCAEACVDGPGARVECAQAAVDDDRHDCPAVRTCLEL